MKYLIILLILILSGCSIKNYETTKTKIVIIKTPTFKFADVGYIRNSADAVELELFVAGNSTFKATINHLVCTNDGCMNKVRFNEEYLNSAYPETLLQNILLAKPIYKAENLIKIYNGFEQNILNDDVSILYRVTPEETYFKDSKNKILFKIKETK